MSENQNIDLARIAAEIEEEVRRKRASGEIPAALERKLDVEFARYAPVGSTSTDLDQLLARADERSHVELNPSVESSIPGVSHVKRATRKAIRWYVRAIAEQVSAFAAAITRAVKVLGKRVEALEEETVPIEARRAAERASWRIPSRAQAVSSAVAETINGCQGRVLIANAGAGELVTSMVDAKVDAYGIDTDTDAVALAEGARAEVRTAVLAEHLAQLEDASLSAVVLVGCTDTLSLGARVNALVACRRVIARDGVLVLVSSDPENYLRSESVTARELYRAQPLSPQTWEALLKETGFKNVSSDPIKDDVSTEDSTVSWSGFVISGRAE